MAKCGKCNQEAIVGQIFCRRCGSPLGASASDIRQSLPEAVSEQDMALFIGKNVDKYLDTFRKFNRRGEDSFALTWHWPAFFVGFWWMIYRKLYAWAIVILVLGFVPYLGLLMMFIFGLTGNYIYYNHVKKKLLELKTRPGTDIQHAAVVAREGGVNNVAVVLAPLIIIAVVAILAAIAIPQFTTYRQRAFDMKAKQEIQDACTRGQILFSTQPEKMLIEPDDLLYAGLVRTPEVEMTLLDGRRETFSISARHMKGGKTYFTDAACALREENSKGTN